MCLLWPIFSLLQIITPCLVTIGQLDESQSLHSLNSGEERTRRRSGQCVFVHNGNVQSNTWDLLFKIRWDSIIIECLSAPGSRARAPNKNLEFIYLSVVSEHGYDLTRSHRNNGRHRVREHEQVNSGHVRSEVDSRSAQIRSCFDDSRGDPVRESKPYKRLNTKLPNAILCTDRNS